MAKQPKATVVAKGPQTKRTGYKRKSNKRVDVLADQLQRAARKALNRAGAKSFRAVYLNVSPAVA